MMHLFILNPAAGGIKNKQADVIRRISDAMSEEGNEFDIYVTAAPMDACRHIREMAEVYDDLRVYACGGDGTLNECVNGAVGLPNVAVTHLPCGTGNDFVKMFGEHDAELFRDIKALSRGFVRPIDVIECCGRYGVNICSVGLDARIGVDVHKYSKLPVVGGAGGYVVSLAANLFKGINQRYTIKADNYYRVGEYALACASNGRYYGGGFNPTPEAQPDDGLLDFLVVKKVNLVEVAQFLGKYAKGRAREIVDKVHYFKTTSLEIHAEDDIVVQIDGEAMRAKDIVFNVVPAGINFVFPQGMEFFDKRDA